jgi:cysteine-rich repeat protein
MRRRSPLLAVALVACAGGEGGRTGGFETESDGSVGSVGDSGAAQSTILATTFDPSSSETASTNLTQADDDDGNGPVECGNGDLELGEDCDDGNTVDGDGCNGDCTPSGQVIWEQTVGGEMMAVDEGLDVVADGEGNFVVVGYTGAAEGVASGNDGWIRRYSPMGGAYWTVVHTGPGGGSDQMFGVALDDDGSAYVGGFHSAADGTNDAVVRKVDTFGADAWTSTFDAPDSTSTIVQGVAVDGDGDVVVVGYASVTGAGRDTVLRKYTPDGTPVWTRTYGGDALGHDVAFDVSTTANGSLYVAGYETVDGEGRNMWLGKYDTDGNLLWSRVYNGIASLDDQLVGVVAGPEGEAYVCGYESAMDIPWHSFVRRYDADGNIEWTDDFTGDSAEGAHCYGIARTPGGDLIVTGGEIDAMIRDVMMRRYTADGEVRWSRHIPGGALGPDYGRAIATDDEGLIYVTGSIDTGVDARDIWVARVSP